VSILDEIFEHKLTEIAAAQSKVTLADVVSMARDAEPPRGFLRALTQASGLALVAEVKKASPSKGVIREDFNPVEIARSYEQAGAHALSVLTDEKYFQGSQENLRLAKRSTLLPCLRKDFIRDTYQIYEARAWGADAILLIVSSLSKSQIEEFQALARDLGMDTLVEVHSAEEAQIAVQLGCPLVGVNNRNLSTFDTAISASQTLIPPLADSGAFVVSESALTSRSELDLVQAAGAKAVLIGTTFCASADIESKVKEVMGW